ncbi:MAG: TonB-dependent receptor [Salegentibacter sp.]
MKQFFLCIAILASTISMAFNDPIGRITGSVIDEQLKEPIPYATVLINDMDGNLVSGNTSAEDGSFVLEKVPAGKYIFKIQFIGYKPYTREIDIEKGHNAIAIGTVALEPDVAMLDGVTVVSERSTIEQRVDRKIINVGKDLTTAGATASEIMVNLPSITVDQDGNISMRGNDNVRILVDGKPTNIPAAQLLKQIPSTSIKKIELITNPSAKYNPEGMSGIINIVLHKNTQNGFNGNLDGGVTFTDNVQGNGSLNMNYRRNKFNFYANLGGTLGKSGGQEGQITNLSTDGTEYLDFVFDNTNYLYKVGVDYYLDDNNTLSFYTNQNHSDLDILGDFNVIYPEDDQEDIFQHSLINNLHHSATYNFDYKHDFAKEGHNIELEADYNHVDADEDAQIDFTGNSAFEDYQDLRDDQIENTTINLDYVNPLSDVSKLELGAEARLRNTDQDYQTNNANLMNRLYKYDNSIYSAYATFGQTFEKWSYQLGARLEQYDVQADLNAERVYEDNYLTVYPTAFLSYNLSEKKSLQFSFGRRVDRPSLGQVSPIRDVSTPRLTVTGNPELEPQFTNSVEFNYNQNLEKGNLTAGTFFRRTSNAINQIMLPDEEDPANIIMTYANADLNFSYGFELSGSFKPVKWWNINGSAEFYSQKDQGIVGTEEIEVTNTNFDIKLNQSFKANDQLSFQLFGFYQAPVQMLQIRVEDVYFVNLGARYSFWNDKASLSLNMKDIFNTREYNISSEAPVAQEGTIKPHSRQLYVGFSYRFGGSKYSALKRKHRDEGEAGGGGIF